MLLMCGGGWHSNSNCATRQASCFVHLKVPELSLCDNVYFDFNLCGRKKQGIVLLTIFLKMCESKKDEVTN
jgi:hypothetical protein